MIMITLCKDPKSEIYLILLYIMNPTPFIASTFPEHTMSVVGGNKMASVF